MLWIIQRRRDFLLREHVVLVHRQRLHALDHRRFAERPRDRADRRQHRQRRAWADLYRAFDFQIAGGAEIRALSAIDLALWDLLGKHLRAPVYRLIGGKANPRVRLYNTCFPYKYDFNREPEKIMRELIETRGINAIKIWPFDGAAARNRNQYITPRDIEEGLRPVQKLRETFGSDIDIAVEFHAQWNVTSAIRIARALEPYRPMWLEDMLMPGNYLQYHELAAATNLPLIAGERMAGKLQFEQLLESRAVKYVMFDVTWCGGLTEARKIAGMADAFELPIAPHTAGGPLLFYASTHLSTASPNVWIQESCQRFYERDWPAMLEDPIAPKPRPLEKLREAGVLCRAEQTYQQLDFLMGIRKEARKELLPESRKHPAVSSSNEFRRALR